MRRTDLLLGSYRTVVPLHRGASVEIVRAEADDAAEDVEPAVLVLARAARAVSRERTALSEIAGPGIPGVRAAPIARDVDALALDLSPTSRPLASAGELPAPMLRNGLAQLLVCLSRCHARGRLHGHVSRSCIFVDADGGFTLLDWADSTLADDSEPPPPGDLGPVATDLQGLGAAFAAALLQRKWTGPESRTDDLDLGLRALQELPGDRDFRRVVTRLMTPDPREAYRSANDVLADLGHLDGTDPWRSASFVGRGAIIRTVERYVEWTAHAAAPNVHHVASIDLIGPHAAGKSRLLGEIAASLRARGAIVLQASAEPGRAWGGVADIARQLVQLVGREHHAFTDRQELLDELTSAAAGPGDTRKPEIIEALLDLCRAAFDADRGVLLMDDAQELPRSAADVWRALARCLCADNERGLATRAVVVNARDTIADRAPGVAREDIQLEPWSARDIESFLRGVMDAPACAAAFAARLIDLVGGWPGEIVDYLRDLERRGDLQRIGARWRLDVPVHSLAGWSPGMVEFIRRARDLIGRDAVALIETLAIAGPSGLSRSEAADLAELSGPRLWTAADRAEAAGLIIRTGTEWHIRTESMRRRVYATAAESRRVTVHRELLARTRADAVTAISAWHHQQVRPERCVLPSVRASVACSRRFAHDQAAAVLRGLQEARADLGNRVNRLLADELREAGRLNESVEAWRQFVSGGARPHELVGATLALLKCLYAARDWDGVIATPVPAPTRGRDGHRLAKLRRIRAAALAQVGLHDQARRELRLAAAEFSCPREAAQACRWSVEARYKSAFSQRDYTGAAEHMLHRVLLDAAAQDGPELCHDLSRLANALRRAGRVGEATAVIARAATYASLLRSLPTSTLIAIQTTRALVSLDAQVSERESWTIFEGLSYLALQTSVPTLMTGGRIRGIVARVHERRVLSADVSFIKRLAEDVATARDGVVVEIAPTLVWVLRQLGCGAELLRIYDRTGDLRGDGSRASLLRKEVGIWALTSLAPDLGPAHTSSAFAAGESLVALWGLDQPQANLAEIVGADADALFACAAALRGRETGAWFAEELDPVLCLDLALAAPDEGGAVACVSSAALWTSLLDRGPKRATALAFLLAQRGPFAVDVEWPRWLAASALAWRLGELSQARDLDGRARYWASRLPRSAAGYAESVITRLGVSHRETSLPVVGKQLLVRSPVRVAATDRGWPIHLEQIRQSERAVVRVRRASEARELAGILLGRRSAAGALDTSEDAIVCVCPELIEASEHRAVIQALRRRGPSQRRRWMITTLSVPQLAALGPAGAALVEEFEGSRFVVEGALDRPQSRLARALTYLADLGHAHVPLTAGARAAIAGHTWPGGLPELRDAIARFAPLGPVALSDGVHELREAALRTGAVVGHPVDAAIIGALAESAPVGVTELSAAVQASRRTVQRRLRFLVNSGEIVRRGRARSTRYALER